MSEQGYFPHHTNPFERRSSDDRVVGSALYVQSLLLRHQGETHIGRVVLEAVR